MRSKIPAIIVFSLMQFAIAKMTVGAQYGDVYLDGPADEIFDNGLFANFYMFMTNNPISPVSIETDVSLDDPDFYKKISGRSELVYYDDNGVRQVEETKSIWGYARDGNIFIRLGSEFHKLSFFGRFSWFVASVSTYDKHHSAMREYVYRANPGTGTDISTASGNEYLVDLKNNVYWEFDLEGLELALRQDPGLYEEFRELKRRERIRKRYIFLKRLNERQPFKFEESSFVYSE